LVILKSALKGRDKIKTVPALKKRVDVLLKILADNPYQTPLSNEKLVGDLNGLYSRRINRQHRIVYIVFEREMKVMLVSMWSHCDE